MGDEMFVLQRLSGCVAQGIRDSVGQGSRRSRSVKDVKVSRRMMVRMLQELRKASSIKRSRVTVRRVDADLLHSSSGERLESSSAVMAASAMQRAGMKEEREKRWNRRGLALNVTANQNGVKRAINTPGRLQPC